MKPKRLFVTVAAVAILAFQAGCAFDRASIAPQDNTKYTLENTGKFVLLDQPEQIYVSCTGLQERLLPDGRLEVVANLKNRENRDLTVQADCVFRDEQGFSVGDTAPAQLLTLHQYATETVRFTAGNTVAKKYTVRVRQAR
jgi:hypothetical protein